MITISVRPPWAWVFFPKWWEAVPRDRRCFPPAFVQAGAYDGELTGPKDAENRTKRVASMFRARIGERLAIQCSRTITATERELMRWWGLSENVQPSGSIVGTLRIVGVKFRPWGAAGSPWHERGYNAILLADPRHLERPLPVSGQLGPWNTPDTDFPLEHRLRPLACGQGTGAGSQGPG